MIFVGRERAEDDIWQFFLLRKRVYWRSSGNVEDTEAELCVVNPSEQHGPQTAAAARSHFQATLAGTAGWNSVCDDAAAKLGAVLLAEGWSEREVSADLRNLGLSRTGTKQIIQLAKQQLQRPTTDAAEWKESTQELATAKLRAGVEQRHIVRELRSLGASRSDAVAMDSEAQAQLGRTAVGWNIIRLLGLATFLVLVAGSASLIGLLFTPMSRSMRWPFVAIALLLASFLSMLPAWLIRRSIHRIMARYEVSALPVGRRFWIALGLVAAGCTIVFASLFTEISTGVASIAVLAAFGGSLDVLTRTRSMKEYVPVVLLLSAICVVLVYPRMYMGSARMLAKRRADAAGHAIISRLESTIRSQVWHDAARSEQQSIKVRPEPKTVLLLRGELVGDKTEIQTTALEWFIPNSLVADNPGDAKWAVVVHTPVRVQRVPGLGPMFWPTRLPIVVYDLSNFSLIGYGSVEASQTSGADQPDPELAGFRMMRARGREIASFLD